MGFRSEVNTGLRGVTGGSGGRSVETKYRPIPSGDPVIGSNGKSVNQDRKQARRKATAPQTPQMKVLDFFRHLLHPQGDSVKRLHESTKKIEEASDRIIRSPDRFEAMITDVRGKPTKRKAKK